MKEPIQYLDDAYRRSVHGASVSVSPDTTRNLDSIAESREKCKAVLAVIITLMLKKIMKPSQDIRKHQAGMPDGFSARVLDTATVTPFMKANGFPYMVSGAGALTRSLEQAVPYGKNYTGKITPKHVKDAFLNCIDAIQVKKENPSDALTYLFTKLIVYRDLDQNISLNRPVNLTISAIVEKISSHFTNCSGEGSELPTLAIYAVYECLVHEVQRFKNCILCDLQSHTAPDSRSGFFGDVQVNDSAGNPFEVIEIKHNIKLSADLVSKCHDKFKSAPIKTYYLLSTDEALKDPGAITEQILLIQKNHGCQMIVNGIQTSLKYYLRLLKDPHEFLYKYVDLLEKRSSYNVKTQWQSLWE